MANLFENHFRDGGEENERRMENNVMQEMRVYDGNDARNSSCYLLSLCSFPLKRKG